MTPTWGQLWLRACALVGWRVRAFCRGVILWRLRRHRIFHRSKRVSGATAISRAQLVEVYGKERPLFAGRERGLGIRSSWANRRPDNYHWRRSAMEE